MHDRVYIMQLSVIFEAINIAHIGKSVGDRLLSESQAAVGAFLKTNKDALDIYTDPDLPLADLRDDLKQIAHVILRTCTQVLESSKIMFDPSGSLEQIKIKFVRFPTAGLEGEYSHSESIIRISMRLVLIAANHVLSNLKYQLQSAGKLTPAKLFTAQLVEDFATISSVATHEVVHALQAQRASGDFYRSYISKDQLAFYNEIENQALTGPSKSYYGSPEEIPAFAHQQAVTLIQALNSKSPRVALKALDGILAKLSAASTGYEQFMSSSSKIDKKIMNRYYKKLYSELDIYRDKLRASIT